jgi:hypothetical protein
MSRLSKRGRLPIAQGFLALADQGLLCKIKNVSPAIRDVNGMEKSHKEAKGFA